MVVGGAAYVGSHMALMLSDDGHEVVVLDLSAGHAKAVLAGKLVRGSTKDNDLLDQLLSDANFDAVIHFASFIQVGESVQYPAKYYITT